MLALWQSSYQHADFDPTKGKITRFLSQVSFVVIFMHQLVNVMKPIQKRKLSKKFFCHRVYCFQEIEGRT